MPWFKVDDKLHDHRKARAAGPTAMGVWLLAGSWSADNLTDGFIPAAVVRRWGRPRDATRLVEVGLWEVAVQDGEEGWQFHEWAERQPSRAETLALRAARAEAGKAGGLASGRSRRKATPKHVASPTVEPPTRPEPVVHPTDVHMLTAEPAQARSADADREFEAWWSSYPRKVGKGRARAAYRAARRKAAPEKLAAAVAQQTPLLTAKGPEFCPHPATWLNGERWLDEAPPPPPHTIVAGRNGRPDPDAQVAAFLARQGARQ